MEIKDTSEAVGSIERPSQMSTYRTFNNGFSMILGVSVLLLVVEGVGYYNVLSISIITHAPIPSAIITPTSTLQLAVTTAWAPTNPHRPSHTTRITNKGMVVYEHPTIRYTLEYPNLWSVALDPTQWFIDYQTLTIRSADYHVNGPRLKNGAALYVFVENTTLTSIDDLLNRSHTTASPEIGKSKTRTTVDGVMAVQYDSSYEGVNATSTIFFKGGKFYRIVYSYVDYARRQMNWQVYQSLLSSFQAH